MSDRFLGLLAELTGGDRGALDRMMPSVYAELRRLAGAYMREERHDHTLQPTALVHEAYLRLVGQQQLDWANRAQVLGLAAMTMRRVLIDHADGRNRQKRPWKLSREPLNEAAATTDPVSIDVLDLDAALTRLAQVDPRQATVVELRFFGGLTIAEVSQILGISDATVEREWATARLWLLHRISKGTGR